MNKKLCFIINPIAGKGKAKSTWYVIKQELEKSGENYSVYFTKKPGDATTISQTAVENGFEYVVSVGGDGTVCEVVNGIYDTQAVLGIIPAGTGNDFVKTVGISVNPIKALNQILTGQIREIDLGFVGNRYFINIAGVGFDAEVANLVQTSLKKYKSLAYIIGVILALIRYKPREVTVLIDGKTIIRKIFLISVANARYIGNGMMLAPFAKTDDGLFDVVVAYDIKRWEVLKFLPLVFKGRHISHPRVEVYKAKKVEILSKYRLKVHADGDIIGNLPKTFEIKPRQIKVIY